MRDVILLFLFIFLMFSCVNINRDKSVNKNKLTARDYRLFQNSSAWELAKAVENENEKLIQKILLKNPNLINYQDPIFGNTLLMFTLMNQQLRTFRFLISNQADLNIHNIFNGTSPIIEAVRLKSYNIQFAKILIQNGANVNDIEIGERKVGNSTRKTP